MQEFERVECKIRIGILCSLGSDERMCRLDIFIINYVP